MRLVKPGARPLRSRHPGSVLRASRSSAAASISAPARCAASGSPVRRTLVFATAAHSRRNARLEVAGGAWAGRKSRRTLLPDRQERGSRILFYPYSIPFMWRLPAPRLTRARHPRRARFFRPLRLPPPRGSGELAVPPEALGAAPDRGPRQAYSAAAASAPVTSPVSPSTVSRPIRAGTDSGRGRRPAA
jgi:hypothetical protein